MTGGALKGGPALATNEGRTTCPGLCAERLEQRAHFTATPPQQSSRWRARRFLFPGTFLPEIETLDALKRWLPAG